MKEFTFSEICKKEVISIECGKKLGCPHDIEFDADCGRITNLIMPQKSALSLFTGGNTYKIPWCEVERIGEDIIWIK